MMDCLEFILQGGAWTVGTWLGGAFCACVFFVGDGCRTDRIRCDTESMKRK